MSRHRRIYNKPTRVTLSATVGTLIVGAVGAAAMVVGPALTGSGPGAGPGSLSTANDLAGASRTASGVASSRASAPGAHGGSVAAALQARHIAELASQAAARRAAAAARQAVVRRAAERRAAERRAAARRRASQRRTQPPGTPQQIAMAMLPHYGWSASQFSCLDPLWVRESGWNPYATNPSSGAYGIPQALPASKMASAGPDWQTNPATQIRWGLSYIQATYGSPCGAWAHETAYGWY